MAGGSGGGEHEDQAWGSHVRIEEALELTDRVEIRQMQARRRTSMEERRFDEQPGDQQNDCEREQATDLHAAWKMGKETRIGFHHVFLQRSAVQGWGSIRYLSS